MEVRRVYGVTGRGSLFLSDAVAREPSIDFIATHHEQSAGYAAAAESYLSGRMSVCLVSTGVGATNVFSAVLSAFQDQLPVLFVSGQNFSFEASAVRPSSKRTYGEQEFDVSKAVSLFTKYSRTLNPEDNLEEETKKAMMLAKTGRPGPTWLDIPLDVQSKNVKEFRSNLSENVEPPTSRVASAVAGLSNYDKPLLLLGQGSTGVPRKELLESILDWRGPIVYETSATDLALKDQLQNVFGSVGTLGGSRVGNALFEECHTLISIGSTFRSGLIGSDGEILEGKRIISFDFDETETPKINLKTAIQSHPLTASAIGDFLSTQRSQELDWHDETVLRYADQSESVFKDEPESIDLKTIADVLPQNSEDNEIFVCDSGLVEVILPNEIRLSGRQRLVHPHSQGAMGYALPAALGAFMSSPSSRITVVVGDGSIMMNIQEIQTLLTNSARVRILVIENGMYAIIRKRQEEIFRGRTVGTDDSNGVEALDFEGLANAFSLPFERVHSKEELVKSLSSTNKVELICVAGKQDQEYRRVGRVVSRGGKVMEGGYSSMVPHEREVDNA